MKQVLSEDPQIFGTTIKKVVAQKT